MEYERLERLWLLLLSPGRRAWARRTWRQIQAEVGGYLRSELLLGFFVALVIGSTFKWLGFPYPVVLGLIIAGTWLVPWMGAILAVLAVWGASLLNFMDVTPVAAVARGAIGSGITLLVFVILKVVVEPKVLNREPYSSLLLIVITVGAVQAIGAIGIIVGPVISNAVQILVRSLLFPSSEHARQQPPADFEALQQRLDALQDHVAALDRANRLPLENMLNNVRNLITQARQTVRHPEQEKNRMAP